jgi:iron complex outermembrane receptor protein
MFSVSARCEEPASTAKQSTNSAAADSQAPTVAQQASAHSTPAIDGSSSPNDIIVTAQHRSEPLQRVPLAVTVIGGVALERSGTNLQTALPRVVPNLRINENSGFVSPYIRGVGTEYANPGLESSVATYLDDIYIARPYFTLSSFADLDHVEVLKGPQGTLYGRNATGGVLRIITNDPIDKLEAKASVTYGRYNRVAADLVLNTPITTDILSRSTISYDRNDGYTQSIFASAPTTNNRN